MPVQLWSVVIAAQPVHLARRQTANAVVDEDEHFGGADGRDAKGGHRATDTAGVENIDGEGVMDKASNVNVFNILRVGAVVIEEDYRRRRVPPEQNVRFAVALKAAAAAPLRCVKRHARTREERDVRAAESDCGCNGRSTSRQREHDGQHLDETVVKEARRRHVAGVVQDVVQDERLGRRLLEPRARANPSGDIVALKMCAAAMPQTGMAEVCELFNAAGRAFDKRRTHAPRCERAVDGAHDGAAVFACQIVMLLTRAKRHVKVIAEFGKYCSRERNIWMIQPKPGATVSNRGAGRAREHEEDLRRRCPQEPLASEDIARDRRAREQMLSKSSVIAVDLAYPVYI